MRLAGESADRALAARVTISLALDVGSGGDLIGALALLDGVAADVDAPDHAPFAAQRGILQYRLGRLDDAIRSLRFGT